MPFGVPERHRTGELKLRRARMAQKVSKAGRTRGGGEGGGGGKGGGGGRVEQKSCAQHPLPDPPQIQRIEEYREESS